MITKKITNIYQSFVLLKVKKYRQNTPMNMKNTLLKKEINYKTGRKKNYHKIIGKTISIKKVKKR
jgi:hypothetical protein